MELIPAFSPIATTSGSFVASTLQTGSQMVIINKSYVNLIFTFASGDQRPVLANDRRAFTFGGASSVPGPNVKWEQQSIDYPQTVNQLENLVYVEIYAPTETITEKYPAVIQRETLPSLVPYNIGHTSTGFFNANGNGSPGTKITVWPSSYIGQAIAPFTVSGGLSYDYFWAFQNLSSSVMNSLPSLYPVTGKSVNSATPNNKNLMSYIPGPFSLAGLSPVDTGIMLNGTYWSLGTNIVWPASFYLDFWFLPTNFNAFRWLLGDNVIAVGLGAGGNIFAALTTTGSGQVFTFPNAMLQLNAWSYIGVYVNNGVVQIYINGVLGGSAIFTGTPVAPTEVMGLGGLGPGGFSNIVGGSLANIGVKLNPPNFAVVPFFSPAARFEMGQLSLNQNYQNAWIDGIDFEIFTGANAINLPTSLILSNTFNPAGLLYSQNFSSDDILHQVDTVANTLQWDWNGIPINNMSARSVNFYKPLTHYNDLFPVITPSNFPVGATYGLIAHGYNILGVN